MTTDAGGSAGRAVFETAAEHASVNVPRSAPQTRAAEMRQALSGSRFDSASHIVVSDGDRFLGLITLEDLLAAPAEATAESLMDRSAPAVAPGVDQEIAAWQAVHKHESALAVVDAAGKFVGLIPPDRLFAVLLAEHEKDLALRSGFLVRSLAARTSSEETVKLRFRHRLPWLILGLAGAMAAADLVGWFETQIELKLMLAFFIPSIVYMADAVGTQTETIVIRGLSVGVPMKHMVARELLTGLAVGIALALLATPFVWWRWGDGELALCVGCALFAACSSATIAAMLLPWLLDRFGIDPAFGSGPLATVIQSLLSILIYFLIAMALVR